MKTKLHTGFTIVELLVVIVVVGILAAITVVSFNGIQNKARNAQVLTLVNQWEKVLELHKIQAGGYPTGAYEYVCLGESFPASSPFAANQCMTSSAWSVAVDTAMMASVKTQAGVTLPNGVVSTLAYNNAGTTEHYRGVLYLSRNGGFGITYALKGASSDCAIGDGYFEGTGFVACRRVLSGDPYNGL